MRCQLLLALYCCRVRHVCLIPSKEEDPSNSESQRYPILNPLILSRPLTKSVTVQLIAQGSRVTQKSSLVTGLWIIPANSHALIRKLAYALPDIT